MWDPALIGYDFGRGHPLAPIRVDLTMRLAREFGVFEHPHVQTVAAPPADEKVLRLLHQADYLAAVRKAGEDPDEVDLYRGLGTGDVPTFAGMYDASALVVGQSVAAAEAVWSGEALHAVNIAGGLHHAMAGTASGFCVFNDVALGIARLLELGATRVAYVDVDVHHGDGTQTLFWDDPRVLTISLHESGRYLFPGTGFADEIGGPGAEGRAVNVALPPATDDARWLRAFDAVVPPLLRAFNPEVLVTQHGCDSHVNDPLAHLALTVDGQRTSYRRLHELAHQVAGGRWLVTGGGGYDLVGVVPRAWTHLLAEACGVPIDPEAATAPGWQAHVRSLGGSPPERMTDGGVLDGGAAAFVPWTGGDPDDPLDQAALATRDAVFPHHGLTV
ncbi:acetoin utilization protein AcuC [Sporichthya sp.]|uniref:acetoin utilization protein AcuC n=1 Tax=Sporichthya sp. TaxID=65475 RepID=UPI0017A42A70|nr:acetoin utilization protein AcuC [Sporichthya sp.]